IVLVTFIYLTMVVALASVATSANAYLGGIVLAGIKIGPFVTGAFTVFITTIAGMFQFYLMPEFLFGDIIERYQRKIFEKRCRLLGVEEVKSDYKVDWDRCRLLQQ